MRFSKDNMPKAGEIVYFPDSHNLTAGATDLEFNPDVLWMPKAVESGLVFACPKAAKALAEKILNISAILEAARGVVDCETGNLALAINNLRKAIQ